MAAIRINRRMGGTPNQPSVRIVASKNKMTNEETEHENSLQLLKRLLPRVRK